MKKSDVEFVCEECTDDHVLFHDINQDSCISINRIDNTMYIEDNKN